MDRNWVKADRMSEEYKKGVTEFCKYAAKHVKDTRFILCPCEKCLNVVEVDGLTKLEEHLRIHGIDKTYTCWTYHGEKKGERSSSNLNSNYPFIDGGDNNITVDNDCSNSSGRNDIPNVTNEELHDHPDMSESGRLHGEGITGGQQVEIDSAQWHQGHLCVLHNTVDVVPFVDLHKESINAEHPGKGANWIEVEHNRTFIDWFKNYVTNELMQNNESISDRVKWLSRGPDSFVYSYKSYLINGYTFYTEEHDATSTMQNSGVSITATTLHQSFDKKWSIVVLSNKLNNSYQVSDGGDEELDNIDDPFVGENIPTSMEDGDDFEYFYSRNDHDEGEYVNPEFYNVHGHDRSKPNKKRKRKSKSKKCMYSASVIMAFASKNTTGTDGTDGTDESGGTQKSRKRGIVNMLKVKRARNKGIVPMVTWNDLGQPIGNESVKLAFFIGNYARRNVPITCDDWRKKEWHIVKQALCDEIKETFHGIGDENMKKIISRAGELHRQFRARLRSLAKDANGNYSAKPPAEYANFSSVTPYWKEFVEKSMKQEFMEESKRNKEQAEKMEARYRKACLGYARIRELIIQNKIKEGVTDPIVSRLDVWEYARRNANNVVDDPATLKLLEEVAIISDRLTEDELTNIGTDDLLKRLILAEYSGRVRAVGWGVTKTSLQTVASASEITKLKNDVFFLKNELMELKRRGYSPGVQPGGSSHMDNFDMDNLDNSEHDDDHNVDAGEDLPEGENPCFLYLDPGRRYVGRGILHNDLNSRILHGVTLEEEYVRVQFEVAVKSEFNTKLPVPCDEANVVGDAPGYFLAWPRKLVSLNLEKKPEDKQKEKTVESNIVVSSRPLGYPLPDDVCHDGVMQIVRVAIVLERVTDIEVHMGPYWNADPWIEHIDKENVLEVLDAQWYLYEVYLSKNLDLAAKFSFVSPHLVSPLVDNSDTSLAKCLLGHVDKDHLLLLPYNISKHWILVAINTKTEIIYFMDPARMTNATQYKDVKTLIETAMRTFRTHNRKKYSWTAFNSFRWTNVKCPKQAFDDGIYCAYYVGCFIEDIMCSNETTVDVNVSILNVCVSSN
ncbi:hypothetical protein POM88_037410 [Heracleum sosnowskyi]|uniref:Transposase n=1 Tax=Heracleum sosnowskyi TaxID=360622 RepID=A0AAD8HR19_9APIA|nr:hypothetical protein POM88_037410 [Heracleum sosnowskyi]